MAENELLWVLTQAYYVFNIVLNCVLKGCNDTQSL